MTCDVYRALLQDVHFAAVPRADTEPRDGKHYLIENEPEMWLFHGLNNGKGGASSTLKLESI